METTKRLLIPFYEYNTNHIQSVKALLGNNSEVENIVKNDVVLNDGSLLIDVQYKVIGINPIETYFVKTSEVKPVSPNSPYSGVRINDCNVLINTTALDKTKYKEYIPIQIIPRDVLTDYKHFLYIGNVVRAGMHNFSTVMMNTFKFTIGSIKPLYPKDYTPKTVISDDIMIQKYTTTVEKNGIMLNSRMVTKAKTVADCKNELTPYLINFNELKKERNLSGIIVGNPFRNTAFDVVFIPTTMFAITTDVIDSLEHFLQQEEVNRINYDYYMNVLNA